MVNGLERALIIRAPHINNILDNGKVWEMRSTKTKVRGRIGLIEDGTGLITGEADLVDCGEALEFFQINQYKHLHQVDDLSLLQKWRYPWILENSIRYDEPIPYDHPKGAVIWVKFN